MSTSSTGANLSAVDRLALQAGDVIALVGRVAMGAIFVRAGFLKLADVAAFATTLSKRGVPAPSLLAWIGAIIEFAGGVMVILGLKIRYAALLLILFVFMATAISHRFWEFTGPDYGAQQGQFLKNLTIIGGFLFMFLYGGGRLGADGMMGGDKR